MTGFLLSLAAGFLVFVFVLLASERDKETRRLWIRNVAWAMVTGVLLGRLTPLWTRWEVVFTNPLLLFSMNGGLAAILGGLFAFAGVVWISLWQLRLRRPGTRRWPLLVPVAAALAVVGAWTALEPVVVPRPGSNPGAAVQASIPDFEGRPHALADWKGRVVVVNFWATWCPPCLAELPEFTAFTARPSDRTVVVGVNLTATESAGEAAVLRFVSEHKMRWTQLSDPEGILQKAFEVTSIPTTVVLDPQGRVVDRRVGAVDLFWLKTLEARFGR